MAYVNFSSEPVLATHVGSPRHDTTARQDAQLGPLEWSVVALARRDGISSLSRPGRIAVALGTVFGARRPSPHLADPRLEALRRMSVLSWHSGARVAGAELEAFFDAGFSPAQYETILASIAAARSQSEPRA